MQTDNQNGQYSAIDLSGAYKSFIKRYPVYSDTTKIDEIRKKEYGRLDDRKQIYLDYTGGGLYASSQILKHSSLLLENVFGNPHSCNPSSREMTELVEQARSYVLEYFNASPDEYTAIFTSNASGALKLVGESYPFTTGSHYVLSFDNHNSVNGIREFAGARGAEVTYVPVTASELRIDRFAFEEALDNIDHSCHNLLAYPAQSNFSGVQHPLEYIAYASERGWDTLLDCAAFAPTNKLDIGHWRPDFAVLSFYKIFGYPTGLGCLLVKTEKLGILKRPWFAGGTISIASVQGDGYYLLEDEAGFEDGTVDYLNIPAVEIGLRHIQDVSMDQIHERVMSLTGWLLDQLTALRHQNGQPLVHIHGPRTTEDRGGTVTISLYDPNGEPLDDHRIEELAYHENISLRTGCFCNPGAGEVAHKLTSREMVTFFAQGESISFLELRKIMNERFNKTVSAVRVSLGIASNFNDVYHFMRFISGFLDRTSPQVGAASSDRYCDFLTRDAA